jgi:hypothetical protein
MGDSSLAGHNLEFLFRPHWESVRPGIVARRGGEQWVVGGVVSAGDGVGILGADRSGNEDCGFS